MPRGLFLTALFAFAAAAPFSVVRAQPNQAPDSSHPYLGFDRNDYPGDEALPILRKSFVFTSYWLSPPPGASRNSWLGKRALLQSQGFGFLLLFTGRETREIKSKKDATSIGTSQAQQAAKMARSEGFPAGSVIFLDIEEGGRLPDSYHAYVQAWTDALANSGFQAGVYCSGIPVNEGAGVSITTADDIHAHMGSRTLAFWVYNDACPPSPGCATPAVPPAPAQSKIPYADVWQLVRSPREKQIARHCSGYAQDGNCYAPGDLAHKWFLDINAATSPDPSAPKNRAASSAALVTGYVRESSR